MTQEELEDRIANTLCDFMDDPSAYEEGCQLGIHRHTFAVELGTAQSLGKDYETYPLDTFIVPNEDSDLDIDMTEVRYVASCFAS